MFCIVIEFLAKLQKSSIWDLTIILVLVNALVLVQTLQKQVFKNVVSVAQAQEVKQVHNS